MSAAARARAGVGCVVAAADGLVEVLTDDGRVVAGLGGAMLARVAHDAGRRPAVGDWVALTWWPDGPVTVERGLGTPVRPSAAAGPTARVLPLRRPGG